MHGNMSEWCGDWYDSHFSTTSPTTDPFCTEPSSVNVGYRVVRGGSWRDAYAGPCRSAHRGYHDPTAAADSIGFRVAADVFNGD